MNRYMIGLCALLATVGCGGAEQGPPKPKVESSSSKPATNESAPKEGTSNATEKPAAPAAKGDKKDWTASMGTATVTGKVNFKGAAPERKTIETSADPKCAAPGGVALLEEGVVVNDGGLADVIISVTEGVDGYKFPDGTGTVKVEQKGCQYIPHSVAMQKGQTISFTNEDDTTHNVHGYPKRNQPINQGQPAKSPPIEKVLAQKDAMFPVKCDMHPWMNCNVAVFDHPFFAVSDSKGAFTMPKLPAGTYTLTAEHQTLGKQKATVTVTDGGTGTAEFTFEG